MTTLWQESARQELVDRAGRLRAESPPAWGRFTCTQMMAHVNDSIRMATGELQAPLKNLPLRYFPLKQLLIYVLPVPRGAPTSPALLARCDSAAFAQEAKSFPSLLAGLATQAGRSAWPAHPAFGAMSGRAWGVLGYKHIDHHFRQFGV